MPAFFLFYKFYCLPCLVMFHSPNKFSVEAKFDPYISISVLHIALFFFYGDGELENHELLT